MNKLLPDVDGGLKHSILRAVYVENKDAAPGCPVDRGEPCRMSRRPESEAVPDTPARGRLAVVGLLLAGLIPVLAQAPGTRWTGQALGEGSSGTAAAQVRSGIAQTGAARGSLLPAPVDDSSRLLPVLFPGFFLDPVEPHSAKPPFALAVPAIGEERWRPGATALPSGQVAGGGLPRRSAQGGDSYTQFLADEALDLSRLFGLSVRTIVIDPGHGGKDPGATGMNGLKEKDVTLDIAKRLWARLHRRGFVNAYLTRDSDKRVSLRDRAAFANERKADLFLSIHVNYLTSGPETVIETYYFGPHGDEPTRRLAEQENRSSGFSLASFERVIGKLKYEFKHQQSKSLAGSIHRNLYEHLKRRNHRLQDVGIKTAPFVVLLDANMPSVLAEVTCLNNPREAARLATPAYREHIAEYLDQGIVEYLQNNQPTWHAIRGARHDDDRKDRS